MAKKQNVSVEDLNLLPSTPTPTEEIQRITRVLTRQGLGLIFLGVVGFSLLTGDGPWLETLMWSVGKAILAVLVGQIFMIIVSDALVRSIAASAREAQVKRRDGGLLFHFLGPDPGESGFEPPEPKKSKKEP